MEVTAISADYFGQTLLVGEQIFLVHMHHSRGMTAREDKGPTLGEEDFP